MKKIYTILVGLMLTASVFAQTPQKMSYQAVVRNASSTLVTSTGVGMQISILQGSAAGSAVYVETQTPTTNANGLVSLEIGTGTLVSGTFSTIDWANGPYFIKIETDPTGGSTYTITGTNQLLSVPYALHAKTAENVSGITTTSVAEGTNLYYTDARVSANTDVAANTAKTGITTQQASDITANTAKVGVTTAQATILGNTSGTNTGDQDGSETKVTAGTNVTVTGTGTTASPYVVNATSGGASLTIGQSYQGGKIFWIDATGQHGLIAAAADQSTGIRWYAGTYGNTQAKGDGLYAGEANTAIIIAAQVAIGDDGSTYAARICNELQIVDNGTTYGDWYLPSKYELNLLYLQKTAVGGFASAYYWSSTEYNSANAWGQSFVNGYQSGYGKDSTSSVRAIRAF